MGYNTYFTGSLQFNKSVTEELKDYINKFSSVRHMRRNVIKLKEIHPNWNNECYKGSLGYEGEYFIGRYNYNNEDIIDCNRPPVGVPGLWCQWIINDDGELEWDGNEKFYNYVEWLEYLIYQFFAPEGYVLNGTIEFQGEESNDCGYIKVVNNKVEQIFDDGNTTIKDYSDGELIEELENRGYDVKKGV